MVCELCSETIQVVYKSWNYTKKLLYCYSSKTVLDRMDRRLAAFNYETTDRETENGVFRSKRIRNEELGMRTRGMVRMIAMSPDATAPEEQTT